MQRLVKHSVRRLHREARGSIMLFGLAVLGFIVVPMTAILYFASQASNATTAARGIAFSTSYAGLSRSIDADATLTAEQPQLYGIGSPGLAAAEAESKTAVSNAWVYSGIGRGLTGSGLSLKNLPYWSGYTQSGGAALNPSVLGVVNVAQTPASAFKTSGGNCSTGVGTKPAPVGVACWVDHRVQEVTGRTDRDASSAAAEGVAVDSWDHFSSGLETELQLTLPVFIAGLETRTPLFRSTASFAQPCLTNDCAQ